MKTSNQMDDLMDDPDEMRKRLREAKRALACILHNLSYCPWCHKKWHKTEVARRLATVESLSPFESETQMRERIEKRLDETMQLENLKVEYV